MSNLDKLKEEVITDPLGRGYSAMTNQQVMDSLNNVDRTQIVTTRAGIRGLMTTLGPVPAADILEKLETAAGSNKVLKWLMFILKNAQGEIDTGNTKTRAQIDALVIAGVLSNVEGKLLKATAEQTISRAAEIETWSVIKLGHIESARAI